MRKQRIVLLGALSALLLVGSAAFGQTDFTWIGGTGNWSVPANWDDGVGGGGPPAPGDNVLINQGPSAFTLTMDAASAALNDLTLSGYWATGWTSTIDGTETLTVAGTLNANCGGNPGNGFSISAPLDVGTLNLNSNALYLSGANTFANPINIQGAAGVWTDLYVRGDGALGTVTVNVVGQASSERSNLYIDVTQTSMGNVVVTGPKGGVYIGPRDNDPAAGGGHADDIPLAPAVDYDINNEGGMYLWTDLPAGASVTLSNNAKFGGFGRNNQGRVINVAGTVTLNSDLTVTASGHVYNDMIWSGPIVSNGHTITVQSANTSYLEDVSLNQTSGQHSGNWVVKNGDLRVLQDGALGTGSTVTVQNIYPPSAGNAGRLTFMVPQTSTPDIVLDTGQISLGFDRSGGATPLTQDVTVTANGGTVVGTDWTNNQVIEFAGTFTLDGDLKFETGYNDGRDVYMSGLIQGTGKLIKSVGATSYAQVHLNGTVPNTFSGGVDVLVGAIYADGAGALGTGTARAAGGLLKSTVAGAFDGATVVIADENGTVEIASTETAPIYVMAGGGFKVSGGSTVLDYTPGTGNIQVEAGSILDEGLGAMGGFPLITDFLAGDGGYGAFVGATSGNWNVGAAPSIYRGLAATQNATFDGGSVTELAGGTEGIGMLATGPATFTYTNSTFSTDAGHALKLYGAGTHAIGAGNTFNSDIDMLGPGRARLTAAGAISGHTINIDNGRLQVDVVDALDGAVANINNGGIFVLDRSLTTGNVNVASGGVVTWDRDATRFSGGATWDFQPGSGLLLTTAWDPEFVYPLSTTPVNVFTVDGNAGWFTRFETNDVPMGDDSRVTAAARDATTGMSPGSVYTKNAKFYVADGNSSGRFTAATGATLPIGGVLDFTGKTLISGDANPFATPIAGGASGFALLGQAGTVYLTDGLGYMGNDGPTTVVGIGKIDVQAGTFRMQRHTMLGGATEINLNTDATMYFSQNAPLTLDNTLVKGNGTVRMAAGQTLTLNATGTGAGIIAPGASAGALAVTGNLTVSNDGGGNYGQVAIEVVSDGGVAGTDHDVLAVTGTANVSAGELVVALPLPGAGLKPSTPNWSTPDPDDVIVGNLGDMTVLTAATVTGPFAVETLGATIGVDADPGTPGLQPDYHYMLATGAVLADYSSGTDVVLKGADILWMGMPGDANLDDSCDVSDLSLLAGSYRKSGNWLQGDFNFDGNVDVSDLSLLAGNFRTSNPYFAPGSGGAPVPEPVTLVLLGLGGIGLVARRRRK